eukprot:scaffold56270_cov33-Phaeocystis_antarctica.AAC.1
MAARRPAEASSLASNPPKARRQRRRGRPRLSDPTSAFVYVLAAPQRCAVTAVTSVTPLPVDCQRGVDASAES